MNIKITVKEVTVICVYLTIVRYSKCMPRQKLSIQISCFGILWQPVVHEIKWMDPTVWYNFGCKFYAISQESEIEKRLVSTTSDPAHTSNSLWTTSRITSSSFWISLHSPWLEHQCKSESSLNMLCVQNSLKWHQNLKWFPRNSGLRKGHTAVSGDPCHCICFVLLLWRQHAQPEAADKNFSLAFRGSGRPEKPVPTAGKRLPAEMKAVILVV